MFEAALSLFRRQSRVTFEVRARVLAREILYCVLAQLPLFPRATKPRKAHVGPPIVYVHGYAQTSECFWALARALASRGHGPMFAYEYSSLKDIESSADGLEKFIRTVRLLTGAAMVDLIGHSMGGLVIVEHLRRAGRQHSVRRCVTLASPHAGIRWRGPVPGRAGPQLREGSPYLRDLVAERLPIPVLNVSAQYDGVVHPAAHWAAEGSMEVMIQAAGHVALLFSGELLQTAHRFLADDEVMPPVAPLDDFADGMSWTSERAA